MRSALLKRWTVRRPDVAPKKRASRHSGLPVLMVLALIVIAFLIGAVAGLDSPVLLTLLAGPVVVLLLFFMVNAQGLLISLFVMTFVIQGSALYFLNLRQATWVAVGMAAMFFVRIVMDLTFMGRSRDRTNPSGGIMFWLLILAGCYVTAFLLNRPQAGLVVASLKSFWPMFGVLLAFYWIRWTPERLHRLWQLMVVVLLLQTPIVLWQHVFVASIKAGAFDSVVGTFGGTQLAGGLSSVLVMFTIITLGYVLACWNRGLMTNKRMLVISIIALFIILMGEVKASFIWLPLAIFFVLRKRALRNISSLIGYGTATVFIVGAIFLTYNQLYWANKMERAQTVSEKFDQGGGYFFDPENVNYETGEISRGASLALWATDRVSGPLQRLLGYGPGASKSGSKLGKGEVARRYAPLYIDATALAVLLWEMGVIGALTYAAMIVAAIRAGWRFIKAEQGTPWQLAAVEASVAAMGLCLTMLFYNRTLMDEPTMQLLFVFCLGYILHSVRFGPHPANHPPVPAKQTQPHGLVLRPQH